MSLFVIKPFEVGEYETDGKVLGSGSFSVVCLGRHRTTQQPVAIKIIKKEFEEKSQRAKKQLQAEISIMQRTAHPNIIKLHAVQRHPANNALCLVLEYCDGGDFESYLRAQPHGRLKEDEAKHYLVQLVRGLHYLRSLDVIHRDLKPENLLLQRGPDTTNTSHMQLKIGDFGLARAVSNPFELAQTQCGSQLYMSPEIWLGEQYTYKTDLWSFGVILFRTLTGRPLFKTTPSLKQLKSALPHEQLFQAEQWRHLLSPLAADLLTRLLVHDPTRRITWEEFMLHPYWSEWLEHDTPQLGSQLSNTSLAEDVLLNDLPLTRVTAQRRDSASNRSSTDSSDLSDFHVVKQHSDDVYSREGDLSVLRVKMHRLSAAFDLADRVHEDKPVDALVLYIKLLQATRQTLLTNVVNSAAPSTALVQALKELRGVYQSRVTRYESLKSRLKHESSALVESVEQIIFQRVLLLGREAATEEAIHNHVTSADKYAQGLACLELLLDHDHITLADHDRALIRTYVTKFQHRLEAVRN